MKKWMVLLLCMSFIGCSPVKSVDLSGMRVYGYQPHAALHRERTFPIVEEHKIEEVTLLKYTDGISFIVTPENTILSIGAPSEMEPMDSRDGIRQGDPVEKAVQRLGKSFTIRREQGAIIYSYRDSKNHLILEYWTVNDKVQTIRFKAEDQTA